MSGFHLRKYLQAPMGLNIKLPLLNMLFGYILLCVLYINVCLSTGLVSVEHVHLPKQAEKLLHNHIYQIINPY